MKPIIETDRLLLRELNPDDAEAFFLLNENPNVIRYTGNSAFEDVDAARKFLENYSDYAKNGYGRWAVIDKNRNKFVGWSGLKYHMDLNETDIGYRFYEEEWNKGYATESAKACLDYGFEHLGLQEIVGRVMKENKASIQVLVKIGLRYDRDILLDGEQAELYKIEK